MKFDATLPFTLTDVQKFVDEGAPTPLLLYDEKGISDSYKNLQNVFGWIPGGYKNYYAVKAAPTPKLIQLLHRLGCGMDCSSLGELIMCERLGITGKDIMFTSNNTPYADFQKAHELGANVNFDDLSHVSYYEKHVGSLPEAGSFRYNPGSAKKGNTIMGEPAEAKYGITADQVISGYRMLRDKGVKRFGIHTMMVSNEQDAKNFEQTIDLMIDLVVSVHKELGITFEYINLGGGFGIPVHPDDNHLDVTYISEYLQKKYTNTLLASGHPECQIVTENGRYVTGPHGYLVMQVRHKKDIYKEYIGVDGSMADFMRPGMYGSYHHISVLGKEHAPTTKKYDVTGSLCENNDKFCIDRDLPEIEVGDYVVLHSAGAHGRAMGFNYNAKMRCAEYLLKPDVSVENIRRQETLEDYFATAVW